MWNPTYQEAFNQIKKLVCKDTTLQFLWCSETCHCPSWCIKEGTWSCTPARRMPSHLCFQSSYPYRATICQHRTWDVSLCLWSWMISHLCLWLSLHHTELWCHHQVWRSRKEMFVADALSKILTPGWSRGGTWHSKSPCPDHPREETGVPEDNPRWPTPVHPCRDNSGRMAWGYQGHTQGSTPLPQPPWCHDCRRWTYPKGRSSYHSTIGKGEDTTSYTQRTHGNHQVPVPCKTMHILAWNQWRHQENGWSMPNMSMSSSTGTKTSHSNQPPAPETSMANT